MVGKYEVSITGSKRLLKAATLNAAESVHRQFRKLTKTKGGFTNENSLLKLLYAGILKVSERWSHPVQNWSLTLSQLAIHMQLVDEAPGQGAPKQDWFSTHPFSPMRVKALELYDKPVLGNGKMSKDELEVAVQGVMSLMEPSYLEGQTKTAIHMRRLLFTASICVANASDGISKEEIATFDDFFGEGEFDKGLNVEAIMKTLDERINTVKEVASIPQRMQILNDLCTMSSASGHTTEPERDVMNHIADVLDVPRSFICQSLAKNVEPD